MFLCALRYIADTGTAVTALALCYDVASTAAGRAGGGSPRHAARAQQYLSHLSAFDTFVRRGVKATPQCTFKPGCAYDGSSPPRGETCPGWINATTGALGDGYYKGRINTEPCVVIAGAGCVIPFPSQSAYE